jgi:hypothetical protein
MQVVKEGKKFFTRIFENGENFESGDFNTLERAKESLNIVPTIEENNRIINEFVGLKPKCELDGVYSFSDMPFFSIRENDIEKVIQGIAKYSKYHTDWNWLMKVVEKIESLGYSVNIENYSCVIEPNDERELFIQSGSFSFNESKINATYNACVKFINSYNY